MVKLPKITTGAEQSDQTVTIDISWSLLIKLAVAALIVWSAFALREIIFMVFVVFIFVAAVNPTIKGWQKHMSRTVAVALFFTLLLLVLGLITWLFVPRVIEQISELVRKSPTIIDQFRPFLTNIQSDQLNSILDNASSSLTNGAKTVSTNIWQGLMGVFGGIATLVSGLVLSFYLLLEEKNAREFFHQVFPRNRYMAAYNTVQKISDQMGMWIRGQLTVMLLVGILNFIAYLAIGVPSPLPLGIWSGLCEIIPYIGPVLGVLPGVVVAATTGNMVAVILVIVINYVVIQQLQNFVITPRVMSRAIGLSPALLILAMLTGVTLFGIFGAVIAIPCAAIVAVIAGQWTQLKEIWSQRG